MSWHRPAGALADAPWEVTLPPERAGWEYSGLHVRAMIAGQGESLRFPEDEIVIVPLSGSFVVGSDVLSCSLQGRRDLFSELTDRAYFPPDITLQLTCLKDGEVAVCTARATRGGPARYLDGSETHSEVRGGGAVSRQINGLWPADVEGPERLIVVEVITPAGNWSSYPPHKHDEMTAEEVPLEEIYYFRIAGDRGFGFHRTYTSDRKFDESVCVGDGDVFLVPEGFHGPCAAAPGYDMYYLNVMAGPERAWSFSTDPAHRWVGDEIEAMPADTRLPRR